MASVLVAVARVQSDLFELRADSAWRNLVAVLLVTLHTCLRLCRHTLFAPFNNTR